MASSSTLDIGQKNTVGFATNGGGTTSLIAKGVRFFSSDSENILYKPNGRFTTGGSAVTAAAGGTSSTGYVAIAMLGLGGLVALALVMRRPK